MVPIYFVNSYNGKHNYHTCIFRNQIVAKKGCYDWQNIYIYQQLQNTLYYANSTVSRWAINTLIFKILTNCLYDFKKNKLKCHPFS